MIFVNLAFLFFLTVVLYIFYSAISFIYTKA